MKSINRVVIFLVILIATFLSAQERIPITGIQSIRLSSGVYKAVAIGGVKDAIRCGSNGEIYTLANRGYSEAIGSVVRISADGKEFRAYSLNEVAGLENGDIIDFYVSPEGFVSVLAREVTKYNDTEAPEEFGATFIVRFTQNGDVESKVKLGFNLGPVTPTAIQQLANLNFLVAGYGWLGEGKVKQSVYLVAPDGRLIKNVVLPGDPTKSSTTGSVRSLDVVRPAMIKSSAEVYLLRGSSLDPVYVLSESGELIRTVRLQSEDMEFSTPKVSGETLIVRLRNQLPVSEGTVFVARPEPQAFPVFSLRDGRYLRQYEWQQTGQLACYGMGSLTFLQDGTEYPTTWSIIKAAPKRSIKPATVIGVDEVSLNLRLVVSCADEASGVPVIGDEAARTYCLAPDPIVTDKDLTSADLYIDSAGRPGLKLTFNETGAGKLRRLTTTDQGKIALLINGQLVLAASLVGPIESGLVVSGGGLTEQQVREWVASLKKKLKRSASQKVS